MHTFRTKPRRRRVGQKSQYKDIRQIIGGCSIVEIFWNDSNE